MTDMDLYDTFVERFRAFVLGAVVEVKDDNPFFGSPRARARKMHVALTAHFRQCDIHDDPALAAAGGHEEWWQALAYPLILGLSANEVNVLADKLARKRVDYGAKNIVEFGEQGIIIRVVDKIHRINNLLARGGDSAVGESIEDAYDDIIGYAGVAYLFLTGQWDDSTVLPPA